MRSTHATSFLKQGDTVDAIYSHAVFIHLNIYDYTLYLKSFARILKIGGRAYFDFMSADAVSTKNALALEHLELYANNKDLLPMLLSFHDENTLARIADEIGFDLIGKYKSTNNSVFFVLEKRNPSKASTKYLFKSIKKILFLANQFFKRISG